MATEVLWRDTRRLPLYLPLQSRPLDGTDVPYMELEVDKPTGTCRLVGLNGLPIQSYYKSSLGVPSDIPWGCWEPLALMLGLVWGGSRGDGGEDGDGDGNGNIELTAALAADALVDAARRMCKHVLCQCGHICDDVLMNYAFHMAKLHNEALDETIVAREWGDPEWKHRVTSLAEAMAECFVAMRSWCCPRGAATPQLMRTRGEDGTHRLQVASPWMVCNACLGECEPASADEKWMEVMRNSYPQLANASELEVRRYAAWSSRECPFFYHT